jgi:hypothetical protein
MSEYKHLVDEFLKKGGEIKKGKPMKRTKGISVQKMQLDAETTGRWEQFQKGEKSYEEYQKYLKGKRR